MTRIRRPLMFAASALLALGLLAPASAGPAGPDVGDLAPDFECKEAVNADAPFTLADLRGRVVLLELFSTG